LLRPYALLYIYRRRLRVHAVQELLAGLGVAVAVALVFATLVASGSVGGSAEQVVNTVIGPATLQLRARGPEGFDEGMLGRVERLSGVKQAAPLLDETATVVGPGGKRTLIYIAGTDVALATLNGLAHTLPIAVLSAGGIGLSRATAEALGFSTPQRPDGAPVRVTLELRGAAHPLKVSAVLGHEAAGALSEAQLAVMPLERLQRLAGLPHRISRVLVQAYPGHEAEVGHELSRLAAGRLTVAPANQDIGLLRQALQPGNQASMFFAAVAALLGLLFAFNAVLLTVPERRRAIADMRLDGARRTAIAELVLFQALVLGLVASLIGLGVGYLLAVEVFRQSPQYLAHEFALGGGTVVGLTPLVLSLAGGVAATCLASTLPLLDLRGGRAIDAVYFEEGVPGNALGGCTQRKLFLAALCMLVPATALFVLVPSAAIPAAVMLALATVLALPLVLATALRAAWTLTGHYERMPLLAVAVSSLRTTTVRSLALATTGAVALFGGVALGGARDDLLRGIGQVANDYGSQADIWVASPQDNQATNPFASGADARRIAAVPGVAAVRVFQGEFIDWGGRRPWLIARPPRSDASIWAGQILDGGPSLAADRLNEGRWIVVSRQIAAEHHARVGGRILIPTPSGDIAMRIAAASTNFGWPTGVVFMSTSDYSRYWGTPIPAALAVTLAPGADAQAARRAIASTLPRGSALEVVPGVTRANRIKGAASEGLEQLRWISLMLIVAAVVALAAALGSSIWQRRMALSGYRLEGATPTRLRLILLAESGLMLGAGCLTGAMVGIYGQIVIDGYLRHVTGFPVAVVGAGVRPIEIFVLVIAVALLLAAVPGWLASRVSSTLCLEGE
jgi:putative ABC transport system permease protein